VNVTVTSLSKPASVGHNAVHSSKFKVQSSKFKVEGSPSANGVRDELERILGSEAFANAGRHSRVLRYLVERTLAGEGDQLKEYVLGTEVFDRPDSYDPRIDSIVRVEVRRLRSRLEDYYRGPGAGDPVRITIPRGAYVPVFERRSDAASVTPVPSAAVPDQMVPRNRPSASFAVIAAAVAVSIGLIVGTVAVNSGRTPSAQASSGPAIAVLPFEHYSASESEALIAARITDAVTTELARVGGVSVASRTSAAQYNTEARSMPEIARALNVSFVMEASAVLAGTEVRVSARLVDGALDRKIWVGQYDFPPPEIPSAARRIAAEAADAALKYLSR
jgi:adenylate cyclase